MHGCVTHILTHIFLGTRLRRSPSVPRHPNGVEILGIELARLLDDGAQPDLAAHPAAAVLHQYEPERY
jgi:hypothetical protein